MLEVYYNYLFKSIEIFKYFTEKYKLYYALGKSIIYIHYIHLAGNFV